MEGTEEINHPSHRMDYGKTISNLPINNYLRNLRGFFNWLVDMEYIEKSPMRRIKVLPHQRTGKSYLTDNEVRAGLPCWIKDQWLIDLIVECQKQCKQTYGIRRVLRWIQRRTGKLVNTKAILRDMRKLDLLSVIRRRRPYTRYQQAVHKYPNLLDRNFDQAKPNRFWVTDITYILIPGNILQRSLCCFHIAKVSNGKLL